MNKVYIHYGADHYDKSKFKSIETFDPVTNKPKGGLWASPVDTDWGWKDWCEGENFHLDRFNKNFKFTLANGSKVFHIRTADDVMKLPVAKFPDSDLWSIGWYYDWKKIVKKYDAVELHMSENYSLFHDIFYCWDVDSIIVLNPDIIKEVE